MRRLFHSSLDDLCGTLSGAPPDEPCWDEIVRLANEHFVAPALFKSLEGSLIATLDGELSTYLRQVFVRNQERNELLREQALELTRSMNSAGVEPTFIKGLALLLNDDTSNKCERMITDLDVLIEKDDLDAALQALGRIGYESCADEGVAEHVFATYLRAKDVGVVDLHIRFPGPEMISNHIAATGNIERHVITDARFYLPSPPCVVAINIVHEMLHDNHLHTGQISVRYMLDLKESLERVRLGEFATLLSLLPTYKARLCLEVQLLALERYFGVESSYINIGPVSRMLHIRRLLSRRFASYSVVDAWLRARLRRFLGRSRIGVS